jgi:ATP-binding cassette subfamily B multidrug efflux pump
MYAQRFFRPIQDLSEKFNILQSAMAAASECSKLLDTEPKIQSPEVRRSRDGPGRIEFDNVWFAYRRVPVEKDGKAVPGEEWDWVLRGVSFAIEPGETVAIVGHTGAGKTTLISLLLRFYDVQQGAVRIDGVDVREMNLQKLRRRCGVVLAGSVPVQRHDRRQYQAGLGHVTREAVERAAYEVNVADFIQSLPEGFDSMLAGARQHALDRTEAACLICAGAGA